MQKLRKQISESFFNPLLHFLPLLTFLIIEDFWGLKTAWYTSLPLAILILIYVYFYYKSIFEWLLDSTSIFLIITTIISFFPYHFLSKEFQPIIAEYICLVLLILSILFKSKVEKRIDKFRTKTISMDNNVNEHFRIIRILALILFLYVHIYLLTILLDTEKSVQYQDFTYNLYLGILFFVLVYEIIRVSAIRIRLLREEWWPIVNETGKVIGSIQHLNSLNDSKKYMHPIIRVMLIDDNLIYLQQRCKNELISPGLWDTAISNHVRMNETMDQCIQRSVNEQYGLADLNTIFLSNYVHETELEYHYAFLFIACKRSDLIPNPSYINKSKWWTIKQIDENIKTGIFTENFIAELDQLKRSGMLDAGICSCKCRLKDTVYEKMNFVNINSCN